MPSFPIHSLVSCAMGKAPAESLRTGQPNAEVLLAWPLCVPAALLCVALQAHLLPDAVR